MLKFVPWGSQHSQMAPIEDKWRHFLFNKTINHYITDFFIFVSFFLDIKIRKLFEKKIHLPIKNNRNFKFNVR